MSSSPKVTTLSRAKPVTKIHCGECNWEQLVLAQTEEALKCCPWCGWSDLEISKVSEIGRQKMREYRDASDRFCIDLSDRDEDFASFASRMTSLHGSPVEKVNGVDQHYWDFDVAPNWLKALPPYG